MKHCEKCRRKVEINFNYCPYCGTKIEFTGKEVEKKKRVEEKESRFRKVKQQVLDFIYTLLAWITIIIIAIFILSILNAMGIEPEFIKTQ